MNNRLGSVGAQAKQSINPTGGQVLGTVEERIFGPVIGEQCLLPIAEIPTQKCVENLAG